MKEKERRKLTAFLAHEMLFDFVTNALDLERRKAVEEFILEDRESQNILEAIRRGISYAESLKRVEITEETLGELEQSDNLVSLLRRLARWSVWPDSIRWSLIALTVSVGTAVLVMLIPWTSIPLFKTVPGSDSGSFEIARVESRKVIGDDGQLVADVAESPSEVQSGPLEGSGDEEFAEESSGARPTVQATPPAANTLPPSSIAVVKPTPPVLVPPAASPVATKLSPAPVVTAVAPAPSAAADTASRASRGYVFRAFMTLSDLENIAPKITQQLRELGAEKAGEVELGWRRGSGRYYHFSLPEISEAKLLETLRAYGPVRISKDPHPRVMPQGQLRFILWIESGA